MNIELTRADISQLGHAYIWVDTQQLFKVIKPQFSKEETHDLDEFLAKSSKINHPNFILKKIEISDSHIAINSYLILETKENIPKIILCLNLFYKEMEENPKEVEALTTFSFSNLKNLVSKLDPLFH